MKPRKKETPQQRKQRDQRARASRPPGVFRRFTVPRPCPGCRLQCVEVHRESGLCRVCYLREQIALTSAQHRGDNRGA